MTKGIEISIPMPLLVSIEDVGWWSGTDGSGRNQPFRTGMPRDHVPEDYTALAALGKGLDTKVLAGFVLCEWDRENILRQLPSATWMGTKWSNPGLDPVQREKAASIIKKKRHYIEFGVHGVGHEFWTKGCMERTEFHNDVGRMRESAIVTKHLTYFFKLMDQYGFNFRPKVFIPPALRHSFGNKEAGFQRILNQFGIQYVTLVFDRARWYQKPQTCTIAWENDVLLVERGEADIKWHTVAAEPVFRFDRPVMALHWANILHPDPFKNCTVVEKWIRYINEGIQQTGMMMAEDSVSCFTQYIHKTLSKVERVQEAFKINMCWLDRIPEKLVGESIYLKVDAPKGTKFRIFGTKSLPAVRPAEQNYLKLAVPKKERKILLRPYR